MLQKLIRRNVRGSGRCCQKMRQEALHVVGWSRGSLKIFIKINRLSIRSVSLVVGIRKESNLGYVLCCAFYPTCQNLLFMFSFFFSREQRSHDGQLIKMWG